jgi:hypothetical protein
VIIQLKYADGWIELAVEVEITQKDQSRVQSIVSSYAESIQADLPCRGVLIVAKNPSVHSLYSSTIQTLSESLRGKFILTRDPELKDLNPKVFGERLSVCGKSVEKLRGLSTEGIQYFSIVSQEAPPEMLPQGA